MSNVVNSFITFPASTSNVTSGEAICCGGLAGSGTSWRNNAQTSNNYSWSNISVMSTARGYTVGVGNASNFLVAGGWNNSIVQNSQYWNGSSWATEVSMSTERRDTSAIAGSFNDCIIFKGRNGSGTLLNTSSEFNGSSWGAGATGGTSAEHQTGAGARDDCLMAGGYTSSPSNLVDSYNGSSISTETVMPSGAYGQGMGATAHDSAHITGGLAGNHYSGTYDGSSWTNTTNYPVTTTHYFGGSGGSIDDHLAMGGYNATGYQYYDTTNLWNGSAWVSKGTITEDKYAGGGDCTTR